MKSIYTGLEIRPFNLERELGSATYILGTEKFRANRRSLPIYANFSLLEVSAITDYPRFKFLVASTDAANRARTRRNIPLLPVHRFYNPENFHVPPSQNSGEESS